MYFSQARCYRIRSPALVDWDEPHLLVGMSNTLGGEELTLAGPFAIGNGSNVYPSRTHGARNLGCRICDSRRLRLKQLSCSASCGTRWWRYHQAFGRGGTNPTSGCGGSKASNTQPHATEILKNFYAPSHPYPNLGHIYVICIRINSTFWHLQIRM